MDNTGCLNAKSQNNYIVQYQGQGNMILFGQARLSTCSISSFIKLIQMFPNYFTMIICTKDVFKFINKGKGGKRSIYVG